MEIEIMILNTMRYEKEGKQKSRLAYIVPTREAFSNRESFKGYSELSFYRNDTKFFDLIPINFIGQKCKAKIEDKSSASNPLKTYKEIVEISYNGEVIRLV